MTPDDIGPQGVPHVAWVFPGFGIGGAQMRFVALANHFGDRCVHTVIALNGDLACRERLRPDLHASFPAARHRPGRMVAAALHAAGFLRALRPNLVVTSNWGAIEWAIGARLAGLRHLHTEDGFGPEERLRQLPRRVLTRRLALRGSKIALPSRTLLRIATDIWRLPPARLSYIPNGIDLARFTGAAPASLPAGQGKVVGTIAALRPEKNIGRLLRAFALLRRSEAARLVIVGDGPERPALAQLARELGIAADTLFAGQTTSPQSWLAAFDIFALSSDTEQMPLSLLEAMASGLPCVCTDVGDVRAMLAPANLDFVAACSDEALAAALRRMLTADGKAIGAANRAKAWAEYGEDAMFGAYAALLEV